MEKIRQLFLICLFCIIVSVSLAFGGYDYKDNCPAPGVYVVDKWSFYQCERTPYAAWALNDLWSRFGYSSPRFDNYYRQSTGNKWGDAREWSTAAERAGIPVASDVWMVGDLAIKNAHVMFVQAVNRNPDNSS